MAKISLKNIEFRETGHLAYSDEYITTYKSVNCVPTIYMSEKKILLVMKQALSQVKLNAT